MLRATLVAATLLTGSAASAATVTWLPTPTVGRVENWTILSRTGTYFDNVTGSIASVRRSPWQGSSFEQTAAYDSISNGQVTYSTRVWAIGALLVWGSPDNGNIVEFLRDGVVVDSFTYNSRTAVGSNLTNSLASILSAQPFNQIRMRYSSIAFEYATFDLIHPPAPVPVPASAALLGGALAGLGVLRRRAKRA